MQGNRFQDQADPSRFVKIIGSNGNSQEKGNTRYFSCRIYFREGQSMVYIGKVDLAKSLFDPKKDRIGFLPVDRNGNLIPPKA